MENEADVIACLRRGYAYVAGNNEVMRVACHAKARKELYKPIYFRTMDKANAAVKARHVVVTPRWLERKPGEKPQVTDEWTYCDSVPLQDDNNYSDETVGWHKATTEAWEETMYIGLVHTSNCGHLRARYENPAWLANKPDAGAVKATPEPDMSVEPLKWEERNPGDLLVASNYGDESDQYTYSLTLDTQASDTEARPGSAAMYYNTWLTALPGMNGKAVGSIIYEDKLGQTLSLRARHERPEHKAWRMRYTEHVKHAKSIEPPFWAERGPGEKVESAGFIKSPDYITFSPDQDLQSGATRSSADGDPLVVFNCWIPAQITDNGIYVGTRRRNPQTGKYVRLRVRHESDDHKAWHDTNFPDVCEDGWRFLREGERLHGGDQRKTVSGWRDVTPDEINDGNSCGRNTIRRRVSDGSLVDVDLMQAYHDFVRAGGPIPRIVAELHVAWAAFISRHDIKTYVDVECGVKTEGWPGTTDIYLGRAYWNEPDADHGHLIRTWKGPLTAAVATGLRRTDKVYCANADGSIQAGQFGHNGGLFNFVFDSSEYQFFLSEAEAITAAHLLWYRSRVENQMSAITPTQNDKLKPGDVTWTFGINGPRCADANMNHAGCFFSEKAAKYEWLHLCHRDQTTRILEEQVKALEDSDVVFWHDKQGSIQSGSWGSAKQWYFDTPFYFSAKAASTDDAAARECKPSEANDQSELQKIYSNATKFRTMSPGFFHSNSMAAWFKANGSHVFVAESDGVKEVAWPRAREVHEGRVHWRYEDAAAHSHELMVKNAGFDKMPVTEARVKLLAAGDRLYYDDNGVTTVVTLADPGDVLSWPRFKNRQLFLSEEAVAWSRGDGIPTPPKGYRRVSPPVYSIVLDRSVMLYNRDEARWRLFDGFNPGPVDITWNAARGTYFAIPDGEGAKPGVTHDENSVTRDNGETGEICLTRHAKKGDHEWFAEAFRLFALNCLLSQRLMPKTYRWMSDNLRGYRQWNSCTRLVFMTGSAILKMPRTHGIAARGRGAPRIGAED